MLPDTDLVSEEENDQPSAVVGQPVSSVTRSVMTGKEGEDPCGCQGETSNDVPDDGKVTCCCLGNYTHKYH